MIIREYTQNDISDMIRIWNEVVEEDGVILGLYILHPNNVGRCGHICNASYAVSSEIRGRTHIKEEIFL